MAPFAKTTFVTGATPASAAELNNFGDGIVEAQRAAFVTALPTTGPGGGALVDGQECYYKPDPNATNGSGNAQVAWHLKYEASSAKWYCLSGARLGYWKLNSAGADTITSVGAYADLPTTGAAATITVPLAGDYLVEIDGQGDNPPTNQSTWLGVKRGAAATADNDAMRWRGDQLQQNAKQIRMTGLTAGLALKLQAQSTLTGGRIFEIGFTLLALRVS